MIDSQSGIEAYMAPYVPDEGNDPHPYYEYLTPRCSPLFTGNANERYVEAITDERFELGVKVAATFDFKKYTHLEITYSIDGGANRMTGHMENPKGALTELHDAVASSISQVGERLEETGFCFGEVKAIEHAELSQEEEDVEVSKRGKVVITLQLGRLKELKTERKIGLHHSLTLESSKNIAVDKGKSHSVKDIPLGPASKEEVSCRDYKWTPARGKNGEKIRFTFFYASRMILELKRIIPTTLTSTLPQAGQKGPDLAIQGIKSLASLSSSQATQAQSQPESWSKGIRKIDRCLDKDDDEIMAVPPLKTPNKRVKAEPVEDEVTIVSPESARKKIKVEPVEDVSMPGFGAPRRGVATATTGTLGAAESKSVKEKERASIQLQLEEIRLRRRLMELDNGE